jgi:hypothetical protein
MASPAAAAAAALSLEPRTSTTTSTPRSDRWTHACLLIIAAAALGSAIQVRDGLYHPRGLIGLTTALAAAAMVDLLPRRVPALESTSRRAARWVFAAALAFNFYHLFTYDHPGSWHAYDDGSLTASRFYVAMLAAAAVLAGGMVLLPHLGRPLLVLLVIAFCLIGGWIIRSVPQPYMDVWMLQTEGIKAFLHGHSPFAAAFADVYHRPQLYAPGAVRADGLVHQGFPYPPVVFWLDLPGYLIGRDYRWSNLAAMAIAALLVGFARPRAAGGLPESSSPLGPLAAAVFLTTPRAFFVLESGWTEPTTVLLLCATVFCAIRAPRLMPVFLGLFLASKQYLLWAIPPVVLLTGGQRRWGGLVRILLIALLVGCAASLPLILWDVRAFVTANFGIADQAAFRTDALSYLAWYANVTGRIPTAGAATVIGFAAALAATAIATLRGPRTPAGYAAALAFAHLVFFAFYKFAFCNYYYFIVAAFCCAAGATGPQRGDGEEPRMNAHEHG